MSLIHTSQVIRVTPSTSIAESVLRMQKNKTGSILIVDKEEGEHIVGIFTERDLVLKIDLFQHAGYWHQPIQKVMSRPVFTLDIDQLNEAGLLMLKKGFRHLPLVTKDFQGETRLVGIISMRDLFRQETLGWKKHPQLLRQYVGLSQENRLSPSILGVVSRDASYTELFRQAIKQFPHVSLEELSFEEVERDLDQLAGLVLDIDEQKLAAWSWAIKMIGKKSDPPFTVILFDPVYQSRSTLLALQKLDDASRFAIFSKPINLIDLFYYLKRLICK